MRKFMGLTKRNLLIYFKDKGAIIFSLLTSLIVLVLYLLFLKGTYQDAFDSALEEAQVLLDEKTDIRGNKIDYDISATPIKRWQIILSYFTSAAISACIMTGILLTAGLVILNMNGGLLLGASDILKAYGMVVLGSVSATGFFMTMMPLFKTSQSSSAFFGMLSAAAGFVIGAYIPISQFSETVQTVCNIFPATHVTVAIRNILMSGVMNSFDSSIAGVDGGMFLESIRNSFSFNARMFENNIGMKGSIIYIGAFTLVSIVVMIFSYSKTYRRK